VCVLQYALCAVTQLALQLMKPLDSAAVVSANIPGMWSVLASYNRNYDHNAKYYEHRASLAESVRKL
jgi:hypothetical protein